MLALPVFEPPAIVQPAPIIEVKRRRQRGETRNSNDQTRSGIPAWIYVGAVIVLTGDSGDERVCHVVHVDYARELYYCAEDQ
jgi:hypothetical protein